MKLVPLYNLFILLLILSMESTAQTQDVKFTLVAGSNGISLGKINGMTRDIHGVMWFSDQTNRCIVSYDGNKMTRYQNDPKKPNSLGGFYPECLFADSSGIIWIGFYGMGLDRFDPETNTFTHYRHDPIDPGSLSNDSVTAIRVDHFGNTWIGNYGGLDLLDPKTGKFRNFKRNVQDSSSLSSNRVRAIYEDREGTLWVGCGFQWDTDKADGGLNRFDRKTGAFKRYVNIPNDPRSLIDNKVRAIVEDSKGNFWIGAMGDGLHSLDRKTGLIQRHLFDPLKPDQLARPALKGVDDHITFITEDAKNHLWIRTLANGLTRYDPETKRITRFGNNAGGSGNFKDNTGWWANSWADGLFWVSTQEASLYKVDLFTNTIPSVDYGGGIFANVFYEESGKAHWYGTDNIGLVRKDLKTGAIQLFGNEKKAGSSSVNAIRKDRRGYFWVGTRGGLILFDPQQSKVLTQFQYNANDSESLNSNRVIDVCDDGDFLWVATAEGLSKLNRKTGKFVLYVYNPADTNSISGNVVVALFKDGTDDLWNGIWNNGGINRMNTLTGQIKRYPPGKSINQFYKDADGTVWAVAAGALFRYNRNNDDYYPFTEGHTGIVVEGVYGMIEDNENSLWLTSPQGVYRLNKERTQIVLFGKESGVVGEDVRYSSINKMSDGKIYIPAYYSYYTFDPAKLNINSIPPKIYFSGSWLNNEEIKAGGDGPLQGSLYKAKEMDLAYDQNVFSISFAAVDDSTSIDKIIYYQLENYDKEWRRSIAENKVYYFKVPPATIRFELRRRTVTAEPGRNKASK